MVQKLLKEWASRLGFPDHSTVTWGQTVLWGLSCALWTVQQLPGLNPLDASSSEPFPACPSVPTIKIVSRLCPVPPGGAENHRCQYTSLSPRKLVVGGFLAFCLPLSLGSKGSGALLA